MAENKGKVAISNPFEMPKTRKAAHYKDVILQGDVEKITHEILEDKEVVFKRYRPLAGISNSIATELNGIRAYNDYKEYEEYKDKKLSEIPYKDIMNKGLLFFMSTDAGLKRTGLLSLCPALLTGIKLYSKMSEKSESTSYTSKTMLLDNIKNGVEAVFKFIYRDKPWRGKSDIEPVFDASPYESEAFNSKTEDSDGRSYMDSISWAVPLFLQIMNLVEDKNDKDEKFVFDEDYRKKAKDLIKWCLDYVNNAVLTTEKKEKKDDKEVPYQRPIGWNFSKIEASENAKAQSSLYFTYAAASTYLSLYEAYEVIIDNLQTLNRAVDNKEILLEENDKNAILLRSQDHFTKVQKAIDAYENTIHEEVDDKAEKVENLNKALNEIRNCDNRKLEEYYFFNNGKSAEFNGKIYDVDVINEKDSLGPITRLKWNLEKISSDIWEVVKDKLEDKFVYDDFNFKEATDDAIKSGGQTNALFAGLLLINICLYSKYDFVVYYTQSSERFSDGSEKFGKKAFNNMQNTMLLHIQRTQRFFDKLEKGKEFGVDSLILRFSEDFEDENDHETAKRLRKQLIRITSLTPMLLKTNNLVSQFVVKYPQKQMGESLDRIGEKRFKDKDSKPRWSWEADGYHAMSNYYYVGAIFDFYDYHEKYEKKYISYTDNVKELREQLIEKEEYSESVQKYYQRNKERLRDKEEELIKEHSKELEKYNKGLEEYYKKLEAKDAELQTVRNNSGIGEKFVEEITKVVVNTINNKPEFLKEIINGFRKQLAKEVFERYSKYPHPKENKEDLEKLKEPIESKDDSLFSLLQALVTDIVLQSAIKGTNEGGMIRELGNSFGDHTIAKVALNGSEQMIRDGKLDKLFAKTFDTVNWKDISTTKWEK
ncbi:MAG: hypothetical protein FWC26_07635 [Fibromonadales bacterium]|nr:hypothetical protein [Fibromonadales bacterium]